MNLRKNKPGVESFIDYAHKKFEELEVLKKQFLEVTRLLEELMNKYNDHEHYTHFNQSVKSNKVNYDSQVRFRRDNY